MTDVVGVSVPEEQVTLSVRIYQKLSVSLRFVLRQTRADELRPQQRIDAGCPCASVGHGGFLVSMGSTASGTLLTSLQVVSRAKRSHHLLCPQLLLPMW